MPRTTIFILAGLLAGAMTGSFLHGNAAEQAKPAKPKSIVIIGESRRQQRSLSAFLLNKANEITPLFQLDSALSLNPLSRWLPGPDGVQYCSSVNDKVIIVVDRDGRDSAL